MNIFSFLGPKGGAAGDASGKTGVHAALDLGSSKIACFIARTEATASGPRPRIVGVGHQSSRGIRGGAVVDMEAARDAIREAVERAERMAGLAVNAVTVTLSSGQIQSARVTAELGLPSREVTDRDLKRLLDFAISEYESPHRVVLHAFPLGWTVDDQRGVSDPRSMHGRTLGADVHVVTAAAGPLRNLYNCIERCHLDLKGVVVTPYASGLAALADDEMQLGATLLDMGAGTTTAAVFADGALLHVDAAPVGGGHVTSDIARGLSTSIASAERLKILYGSVLDSPDDDREMIEVPPVSGDGDRRMNSAPRAMLNAVIRPRIEETFELIRDRLNEAGVAKSAGRRLVLTGGAAQLPGAPELAARVFSKQVRVARPQGVAGMGDAVSGPGFSAVAGVILRETRGAAEAVSGRPRIGAPRRRAQAAEPSQRGVGAVWRWLAESF